MIEVGKRYYFMAHAYHHYLGEVVEILGKQHVTVRNCIRVQSCRRGWTEFFRDGCQDDTTYTVWPDGKSFTFFDATPWHHDIPRN